MRIQLLSDLHLETNPEFEFSPAPNADILVLAGDIGSYQAGSRLPDADFGLGRFAHAPGRAPHIIFVPGNHEFDGLGYRAATERLQAICSRLGIHWLERESLVLDGVRFLGTTLWTDFEALAAGQKTEILRRQQLEKAYRAANFYLRKNTTLHDDGQPMLAEDIRALGLECQQWLRARLAQPFDGATVVITHFAPSLRSADPRYGVTPGTAGFCNAMDDLFCQADVWIHGHLHCRNDYTVQDAASGRRCHVIANTLGYARKGEQASFDPHCIIELPAR
ncbi:metallophosphoesterase [Bordetella holmesii]|uniref:Ser/Thr phosphatase family protein n=2 Tax=Bordetella holmesii TaxID=35814 RepID=A0A158M4N4_9BORD|nr:metallophosphoesterase [Bordetella holmesii]AHV92950.1 calcineurin-like phosphoesterase family protein [Bordetella holmesii ATCC 51541]AIT25782.1 calcineurin-like phosphoesterase family protein [Bordetella holmesii 44057]EWM43642.1 calcineurin-like phosphoesterase family protein [Bordetella holmesii 41130]EWM46348.1 calcineurin-like phosphoesterase family protein [Bordetella holmesii 35009]EWM50510.1 calcineurin-like phosphoesterase family protein [Bordetella holmesii 70147]